MTFEPLVKELIPLPSVDTCTTKLASLPGCLLLDSSMNILNGNAQPLGRYSFLMADPFQTIRIPVGCENPFAEISRLLSQYTAKTIPGLPPMQGGLAGFFSYDLNQSIENIEPAIHNEFKLPAIVLAAYDVVIAWDHQLNRAWLISHGFPKTDPGIRKRHAQSRTDFFSNLLVHGTENYSDNDHDSTLEDLALEEISKALNVDGPSALKSNFSKQNYIDTVQRCIDYIYEGDVFQINLTQRLLYPTNCDSLELYRRLKTCNPSPFGGYFDISGITDCPAQIISASPERLCSVRNRIVETRPIKGTRRRTGQPMVDIQAREELLASEKDRAENTMIVDLMRNDLSIVCEPDSVRVGQLCELEEYQSVLHLVSSVEGKLKASKNLVDLIAAIFPGGSITGAPKVRAMEIISELETTARGAYCGSMGYLGFDGSADLNILIRTITASRGWWQIPVGGGIVSHSIPQKEYEETWTKAAGMLRAVTMNQTPG
ncbi:MAG: anthranilate synthase component I family protein [Pirellulales bacterium]